MRCHRKGVSLAEALNMKVAAVRVIHVPGAGCYGHNGADDVALDAALVARAIPGRPVLLKWSREDEHAWEPYGSCMVMDLCASLDAGGSVVAWSQETYSDTHSTRPYPGPNRIAAAQLLATRHLAQPLAAPVSQPSMGGTAEFITISTRSIRFPSGVSSSIWSATCRYGPRR